ncbi:IS110 family transposase [Isoptericola sp. NPDC019482]|uniref:IS110 family transposase n=1 Tax=Isoptericola sp. NPDC019482 TaxID=3154688 RepID=UPI00347CEEF3
MPIVAHRHPFVVGVDTHARSHALAILAAATGELVDQAQFPATPEAMDRAVAWVGRRTGGDLEVLWVIEGVGTYGGRLAATAATAGYQVVEAARMNARAHRGVGKSDPLDAHRIAAAVLPLDLDQLRHPRSDDPARVGLRILTTARDQMTTERTASINALTALLRVMDLGLDARRALTRTQILQVSRWRSRSEDIAATTARAESLRLATRILQLEADLDSNTKAITGLIQQSPARVLLEEPGIGPVTAAISMIAWSHEGRLRDEAAFASLAGVNPIPASSGNTTRHRLNRGGDRRLNQALHMAVVVRMRMDPETQAYVKKRTAEGRTKREIRRILKRYLARQIYRALNATARYDPDLTNPTPA